MSKLYAPSCAAAWIVALSGLLVFSCVSSSASVDAVEGSSLQFKSTPLREIVAELGRTNNQMLRVEGSLAERRISLFAPRPDADEARNRIALHFGYAWSRDDKGEILIQDRTRKALPRTLRSERTRKAELNLKRRLLLAREALGGDASSLLELKKLDATNGLLLENTAVQEQNQLLRFLREGDLERLCRSRLWLSSPLGVFPLGAQAAAQRWGFDGVRITVEEGQEPTPAQIREALEQAGKDFGQRLIVLQTYGEPDNPAVKGGLVNPLPLTDPNSNSDYRSPSIKILLFPPIPERVQVPVALPMLDKPGKDADDPALQRRISLDYPTKMKGLDHPVRLEDVLAQLARVTGLRVMADSYQSSRGDFLSWGKPLVDVPLWRVLRQINYDFCYEYEVREGWLLFRHRRWPYEEEKELPSALVVNLDAEAQEKKGFSLTRLQELAAKLSAPQFHNLKAVFPELRDQVLPYHTLRILNSLNRPMQNALRGPGLALRQLSLGAQVDVSAILSSTRPYVGPNQLQDLRLFLVHTDAEKASTLRLVFAGGDAVEAPLRTMYPVTGRYPEELPVWFRRAWDELDF